METFISSIITLILSTIISIIINRNGRKKDAINKIIEEIDNIINLITQLIENKEKPVEAVISQKLNTLRKHINFLIKVKPKKYNQYITRQNNIRNYIAKPPMPDYLNNKDDKNETVQHLIKSIQDELTSLNELTPIT